MVRNSYENSDICLTINIYFLNNFYFSQTKFTFISIILAYELYELSCNFSSSKDVAILRIFYHRTSSIWIVIWLLLQTCVNCHLMINKLWPCTSNIWRINNIFCLEWWKALLRLFHLIATSECMSSWRDSGIVLINQTRANKRCWIKRL